MFDFVSDDAKTTHLSMFGLMKTNQGLFKTAKQANYLFPMYCKARSFDTIESVKTNFGIDLTPGQCIVNVDATTSWASYGTNSIRPVSWMYVVDKYGVVAEYKLGYKGTMREGTYVDPTKTKLVWNRTCAVKELEPVAVAEKVPSKHVSYVGRRIEMECTVKKIRTYNKPKFHYYDSSVGYMTVMENAGNVVIYWGAFDDVYEGDTIKIRATIKEHSVRDGVAQTIVNRPTLIKEKQEITA